MSKLAIGISVLNNSNNVKNLIFSILAKTDFGDYEIIVCDDGSTDERIAADLKNFCDSVDIPLIVNARNRGVPYSWNRLVESCDCEYFVILNDDTRLVDANWLRKVAFFLDYNPTVGIVDWRERVIDTQNGKLLRFTNSIHDKLPRLKMKPSGPFFAFRKSVWKSIIQPDNSIGFWEDLIAYREEMDLSAEFFSRGFYTAQLPFYMDHFKSQTFNSTPDLKIRKEYSSFLSEDEYFEKYIHFSGAEKQNSTSKRTRLLASLFGNEGRRPMPTKLEYSRAMFAKKWESRSLFGHLGHEWLSKMALNSGKVSLINLPDIKLNYLDEGLRERATGTVLIP